MQDPAFRVLGTKTHAAILAAVSCRAVLSKGNAGYVCCRRMEDQPTVLTCIATESCGRTVEADWLTHWWIVKAYVEEPQLCTVHS